MIQADRTAGRRRRTGGVAVAVVALLLLTGCVPSFLQPHPTSTPTGERVAPALQKFYSQVLQWSDCGGGFGCATAKAPLDWNDPGAGEIDLALVRHRATGTRIGALLVNPGGPGGSGYDFVRESLTSAVDKTLAARFDVVGFDPRGVGRSTAVKCYGAKQMDQFLYGIGSAPRGSDAWMADTASKEKRFGQACASKTGALLAQVGTESAARDLDLLRAALGDRKLTYLGYSYGTLLGATFAGLYPEKVGRLVLDGALDPTLSDFDVTKGQSVGFEQELRAYLGACLAGQAGNCPFSGGVDAGMAEVAKLIASVDASPMRATDGRMVGGDTFVTAIIYPLYSPDSWTYLSDMFTATMHGNPDVALQFADGYNGRNQDGTYKDNSTEAFQAVNCLDYPTESGAAVMRAQAAELSAAAPVIGPYMAYGGLGCGNWPYPSRRVPAPIHASGAPPILVVGTTGDPATPYPWAVSLSKQLEKGVLVTYHGDGHTAYNKSNACVNGAVDAYLVDGTTPSADPNC